VEAVVMARSAWIAASVAAAALAFAVSPATPTSQAADGCSAYAASLWKAASGLVLRAEAFSNGPSCARAVVTLVVRDGDGRVLWTDAAAAEHLMTFVDAKTRKQMTRALHDWLRQSHTFKSTADLPEWRKGADAPVSGEFPFYPEFGIDRDAYEETRAARQPIFCYVQGMESMACIAFANDGQMTKVGVQSFPG
jgi:hypothetical protein